MCEHKGQRLAWENPEKRKGKGRGRDGIFEGLTGELLGEELQVSWGHWGGKWSPPGREVSMSKGMEGVLKEILCFWGAESREGV